MPCPASVQVTAIAGAPANVALPSGAVARAIVDWGWLSSGDCDSSQRESVADIVFDAGLARANWCFGQRSPTTATLTLISGQLKQTKSLEPFAVCEPQDAGSSDAGSGDAGSIDSGNLEIYVNPSLAPADGGPAYCPANWNITLLSSGPVKDGVVAVEWGWLKPRGGDCSAGERSPVSTVSIDDAGTAQLLWCFDAPLVGNARVTAQLGALSETRSISGLAGCLPDAGGVTAAPRDAGTDAGTAANMDAGTDAGTADGG